ncbi:heptosyltransferase-2 [Desulfonauticus submarinus]|uniref:lipopolysaccharide heptosyltransferase II n=1 Tax=Desulfonauticus submarinus TaxID=206665 RepID=A0A1H0ALN6_9BACT|nr:lipopolysaccharide heptosyltransferase II [Desulfonauticus submarinus]SDN34482.1 heptosyltransferase-2 [Desulfonauticus submarinus]
MKILVWQTAFLGDLILTTPLIQSLKKNYPQSKISLVCKSFGKEVFKHNPYVDELICFDKKTSSFFNLILNLKKKKFNLAISPHRSHRASLSLFLAKIPVRVGFDKAGFSFLYTCVQKHEFSGGHEIERNLKLLSCLPDFDTQNICKIPSLYVKREEEKIISNLNLKFKKYIAIAPGSKWPTKCWTVKGFKEVVKYLVEKNYFVVLLGSEQENNVCEQIKQNYAKVLNLAGKTTLRESFALIKGAKLLISNDSAPVHMAVSLNTYVIAIFGPTVKKLGFYPYKNGEIIEVDLDCRPCGLHGHKKCPYGHHDCMKKISSKYVIQKIEEVLSR